MERVTRAGLPLLVCLLMALALCASAPGARAAEPFPGIVDNYDVKVGGEPGEDPHLKIKDPSIIEEPIWVLGAAGTNGDALGDDRPAGSGRVEPSLLARFWLTWLGRACASTGFPYAGGSR